MIADSRHAFILHESGLQPDLLLPARGRPRRRAEPTDRHTHCPKKGDASYYTITRRRRGGGEAAPGTTRTRSRTRRASRTWSPSTSTAWAGGWRRARRSRVHPRDPYHRVDVMGTDRHIRISLDGELLAETDRAVALFESNLPPRWYIPREDVVAWLQPSDT